MTSKVVEIRFITFVYVRYWYMDTLLRIHLREVRGEKNNGFSFDWKFDLSEITEVKIRWVVNLNLILIGVFILLTREYMD